MSKRRKRKSKPRRLRDDEGPGVRFELEEDANALFLEALERIDPRAKGEVSEAELIAASRPARQGKEPTPPIKPKTRPTSSAVPEPMPAPSEAGAVRIELEEDAEALFLASLDRIDPTAKQGSEGPPKIAKKRERRKPTRQVSIDLHGMTLAEATAAIDELFAALLAELGQRTEVMVVTGKGVHSGPGGGVLPREIHRHVTTRYGRHILRIDDSPDAVRLGGVPIRGHFRVLLFPKS